MTVPDNIYFDPEAFRAAVKANETEAVIGMLRDIATATVQAHKFRFGADYDDDDAVSIITAELYMRLDRVQLDSNVFAYLWQCSKSHAFKLWRTAKAQWRVKDVVLDAAQIWRGCTVAQRPKEVQTMAVKVMIATSPDIRDMLREGWKAIGGSTVLNHAGHVTHYVYMVDGNAAKPDAPDVKLTLVKPEEKQAEKPAAAPAPNPNVARLERREKRNA